MQSSTSYWVARLKLTAERNPDARKPFLRFLLERKEIIALRRGRQHLVPLTGEMVSILCAWAEERLTQAVDPEERDQVYHLLLDLQVPIGQVIDLVRDFPGPARAVLKRILTALAQEEIPAATRIFAEYLWQVAVPTLLASEDINCRSAAAFTLMELTRLVPSELRKLLRWASRHSERLSQGAQQALDTFFRERRQPPTLVVVSS